MNKNNLNETIRNKLRKLLIITGLSRREFSRKSKIKLSTLHDYFTNEKNINSSTFINLLDFFGIDLLTLINNKIKENISENNLILDKNNNISDLEVLINTLKKDQKKELIRKAINLHKLNKNHSLNDLLGRVTFKELN